MTVAIPAKNERDTIANALAAFAAQTCRDGSPLDCDFFEVLVLANDCDDDTVDVVRAFSALVPKLAVVVVSLSLPRDAAHVGSARRIALDIAYHRQREVAGHAGIVASTDADSTVDRTGSRERSMKWCA